ncbi:MAG: hypothetical protein ACRESJ_22555 [Pseudomonas sp.]|uniref:hypothetical protein n=1 Tax=Pseudomonas sp. TaxID=306 RepID=UPI003D6DBA8A
MAKKYVAIYGLVCFGVLSFLFAETAFTKYGDQSGVKGSENEDECRFVAYKQDGKIELVVEYPTMKIVEAKAVSDESRVTIQLWSIPAPEDGVDRAVVEVSLLNPGPITSFGVGKNRVSTFLGRDGREVYVNRGEVVNRVSRKFSINTQGSYQYSEEHTDIRVMDDFALDVFKKIRVGYTAQNQQSVFTCKKQPANK